MKLLTYFILPSIKGYLVTFIICIVFSTNLLSQGIEGTTGGNGAKIIFKENFNAVIGTKFDFTGTPRDLNRWTFGAVSGFTLTANPTMGTAHWFNSVSGFEEGSTHYVLMTSSVGATRGGYIWSPEFVLPDEDGLFARVAIQYEVFGSPGNIANLNNLQIGMAFDGDNDRVPDGPTPIVTDFVPGGPYGDFAGNFVALGNNYIRVFYFDLSDFKNRTGRLGLRITNSNSMEQRFRIDDFVVGTRPSNDMCVNAFPLMDGLNGGVNGFYTTTASGLVPRLPSSNSNMGGATAYVGPGTNGIGSIPVNGGIYDDFNPAAGGGPFSNSSNTVEASTWYKITTPASAGDCPSGNLQVRLTFENLSCGSRRGNYPNQIQFRIYNNGVCGSTADASTHALSGTLHLNNNGTSTTPNLAYNSTYYIMVDPVGANDCRFNIRAETLINGVAQIDENCILLPVELDYFKGICQNYKAHLTWRTLTEKNNDFFTVERSNDGITWNEVGRLDGAGTSSSPNAYSFEDDQYIRDVSYYRLKQTDFDGKYEYFNLIAIKCENSDAIEIFPNPSNGHFFVSGINKDSQFTITNLSGQTVLSGVFESSSKTIDISSCASGTYFIAVLDHAGSNWFKLVKY